MKWVNLKCRVNLGNMSNKVPILFETEEMELPESLKAVNTIASVKADPKHRSKIPKINNPKHVITLQRN